MAHLPRLTKELRSLLDRQRVASLGTVGDDGAPFVSMVPFAIDGQSASLVIHVSGLAAHTHNLQARERVSVLITQSEVPTEPVHALPRVTLRGHAKVLARGTKDWEACSSAYLARFPDARSMTELGDFRFVAIAITDGRHVAGFGAARSIGSDEVQLAFSRDT
jgi:putative heme iron utilization protein